MTKVIEVDSADLGWPTGKWPLTTYFDNYLLKRSSAAYNYDDDFLGFVYVGHDVDTAESVEVHVWNHRKGSF